jgi:membrane protein
VVTLAIGVVFGVLWLWISTKLPSKDVPWTAFLPGAILFGVGLQALHVFTVYFLEAKLANASELYGALGLATTALFYLFLVGRGVVWAAELNSVIWDVGSVRRAAPQNRG